MGLEAIFEPNSVCVIGASRERGKVGNVILQNIASNFSGRIFLIHPIAQEIEGLRCYKSVDELPEPPDIAVISLPPEKSVDYLESLGKKGCKVSIPVSGGFGESGSRGKELEISIKKIAEKYGMRVIGPNTVGVIIPRSGLNTALTEAEKSTFPSEGALSFISQSGALGLLSMDAASDWGLGFSSFVSLGNEADVSENDVLELVGRDKETKSIALYLEKINNVENFLSICKRISKEKGIVLLKGGLGESGNRATSLHTGSLFRTNFSLRGIFAQHGIIQALDETQLLDYGMALSYGRPIFGKRIAVVTSAGGVGVVSSDLLEMKGFTLPKPSGTIEKEIRKIISPLGSPFNPFDMTAEATDDQYEGLIKVLEKSGEYDAVLVFALFQTAGVSRKMIDILSKFNRESSLPIVVGIIGGEKSKEILRKVIKKEVPAYPSIDRATNGLWVLGERGKYLGGISNEHSP